MTLRYGHGDGVIPGHDTMLRVVQTQLRECCRERVSPNLGTTAAANSLLRGMLQLRQTVLLLARHGAG